MVPQNVFPVLIGGIRKVPNQSSVSILWFRRDALDPEVKKETVVWTDCVQAAKMVRLEFGLLIYC
jgi:hypothetical protein